MIHHWACFFQLQRFRMATRCMRRKVALGPCPSSLATYDVRNSRQSKISVLGCMHRRHARTARMHHTSVPVEAICNPTVHQNLHRQEPSGFCCHERSNCAEMGPHLCEGDETSWGAPRCELRGEATNQRSTLNHRTRGPQDGCRSPLPISLRGWRCGL